MACPARNLGAWAAIGADCTAGLTAAALPEVRRTGATAMACSQHRPLRRELLFQNSSGGISNDTETLSRLYEEFLRRSWNVAIGIGAIHKRGRSGVTRRQRSHGRADH
jgi:hypothetical protein